MSLESIEAESDFLSLSGEPLNATTGDRGTELSDQVPSMSAIIPETFQTGDFVAWLRQFECSANANNWDAAAKLRKLPAFLRGPAAAFFHSLADDQKDTYAHLVKFLRDRLCPVVDRERFYAEFESRHLRPNEDPSLFLWALEDILAKADPDLSDAAKQALLGRQFLRGLPDDIKLRLLEHDPTPQLPSMVEFVQRFHAVHGKDHAGRAINHAFTTTSAVNAPQDSLRASVVELTAAVAALTANQKLSDEKSLQAPPQPPRLMKPTPNRGRTAQRWRDVDSRQRRGVRCFNCNQFGHYARSCPWDTQCGLCFGWGHRQDQCANNHVFNGPTNCQSLPTTSTVSPTSSYSLNFNGVPQ